MDTTEPLIRTMTLDELNRNKKAVLTDLVQQAGGVNHLAIMLNIHYMTVKGWIERDQISKEGARLVEQHMTLGEHWKAITLRPDM